MNQQNAHLYLPLIQWLIEDGVVQLPDGRGGWVDEYNLCFTAAPDRYRRKPQELKLVVGEKYLSGEDVWTVIYEVQEDEENHHGFVMKSGGLLGWVNTAGRGLVHAGNYSPPITLTAIPKPRPVLVEGWATYYPARGGSAEFGGMYTREESAKEIVGSGGRVIHMTGEVVK